MKHEIRCGFFDGPSFHSISRFFSKNSYIYKSIAPYYQYHQIPSYLLSAILHRAFLSESYKNRQFHI